MNRILILSTLLAICTLLTESRFLKRLSEPQPQRGFPVPRSCHRRVEEDCLEAHLAKYEVVFVSEEAVQTSLSNRTILDSIAADLNKAVDCMDAILEEDPCKGVSNENWDAVTLMADFMDSSERRDIIQAAVQTHCFTNETAAETAGSGLFLCYLAFMEHVQTGQDVCVGLEELETCTVSAVTTNCGAEAGSFAQSVWDFVENPEVRDSILGIYGMEEASAVFSTCQSQADVVQRFAKRALDVLRK